MQDSRTNWKLDHIGHAVREIDKRIPFYRDVLGFVPRVREVVQEQGVDVLFLEGGGSVIELIAPIAGLSAPNAALERFLAKRGEALHHLCFRVENLEAELGELAERGVRLIDEKPRTGSRNSLVAFLHPEAAGGVLIELCQY